VSRIRLTWFAHLKPFTVDSYGLHYRPPWRTELVCSDITSPPSRFASWNPETMKQWTRVRSSSFLFIRLYWPEVLTRYYLRQISGTRIKSPSYYLIFLIDLWPSMYVMHVLQWAFNSNSHVLKVLWMYTKTLDKSVTAPLLHSLHWSRLFKWPRHALEANIITLGCFEICSCFNLSFNIAVSIHSLTIKCLERTTRVRTLDGQNHALMFRVRSDCQREWMSTQTPDSTFTISRRAGTESRCITPERSGCSSTRQARGWNRWNRVLGRTTPLQAAQPLILPASASTFIPIIIA
jgi:hypothetical protein